MKVGVVAALSAVVSAAAALGAAASPGVASTGVDLNRQSRSSGVAVAGADVYLWSEHRSIDDGGGCTLSFVVRSRSTHQYGALTAGHCAGTLDGGGTFTVHQTQNDSPSTTSPGVALGAVNVGAVRLGSTGDSAFVGLAPGRSARAAVFSGGTTTRRTIPVVGLARPHAGLHVCYSGAMSGEHCGFRVLRRPGEVTFPDHGRRYRLNHEWRATRTTCTSRPGDSGSPVYIKRHGTAVAVGVLSGAQKHPGSCPFYFTPVKLALSQLDLQLVTAS